jgi:uncharacterized membrane protein
MNAKHQPLSLEEIRRLRPPARNVNELHAGNLNRLERFAVWITAHVGTMGFFLIIMTWTALWLSWNTLGPRALRFDPHPAFVLWLFLSNMIQIFLMPLIMIGQNLQGRHTEMRAEADFEVDTKAAREIETILQHLENQNELIARILKRLDEK